MRTIKEELREVIANLPGITAHDMKELMPHVNYSTLTARLQMLYLEGVVLREKVPNPNFGKVGKAIRSVYSYKLNPDPKPVPPAQPMRNTTPSTAGLTARLDELTNKVKELEAWKANAIARYPDLDVDPVVLDARKIVAAELDGSDSTLADQVRKGLKDNILPMRVTIAALSR